MARSPRTDSPGAWHHVMHRGARKEPIFRRNDHCILFLDCLEETVEHHGLEVHAYALMPNHYHLLVRSPLGNLSRCMRHLDGTYTQRLNRRHGWDGPLFRGRFRSQSIEADAYLEHVFTYVHLNPFEAGLARRLDDECWTSLRAYLGHERPPPWLHLDFFSARFGGAQAIGDAVRSTRKRPELLPAEMDRESGFVRPAPASGGDTSPRPKTTPRPARALAPSGRRRADQVLAEVARIAGCAISDVRTPAMGRAANPARRFAVWALSRAQAFSQKEIAAALNMPEGQVAKVLWRLRRGPTPPAIAGWMRDLRDR